VKTGNFISVIREHFESVLTTPKPMETFKEGLSSIFIIERK